MKNIPIFEGFSRPSSDFPAVRSELRAWPNYTEVDLSTARSLAAGTAARLPLAGNMIYIDPKANSGYATMHVQDDSSVGNTPITVLPGLLMRVPFTEILFENAAQPGQVMRIIYGTDLEFFPANSAGVSVLNAININDVIDPVCQYLSNSVAPAIGFNAYTLLAAASNPRGARVRHALLNDAAGGGGVVSSYLFAAAVIPVGTGSQAQQLMLLQNSNSTTTRNLAQTDAINRLIPAGWGIFHCVQPSVAPSSSVGSVSVEVL